MPIEPIRGIFRRLFGWLIDWVENHPRSFRVLDDYPLSEKYWKIPGYSLLTDAFPRTETVIDDCFRYHEAAQNYGPYADYFKHATYVHIEKKMTTMLLLGDICRNADVDETIFVTSDEYLSVLYRAYFGHDIPLKTKRLPAPKKLQSLILLMLVASYTIGFVFSRLNWKNKKPEQRRLGLDFSEDIRSIELLGDVVDDPSECQIIYRSKQQMRASKVDTNLYASCRSVDGFIPFGALTQYLKIALVDTIHIFKMANDLQMEHFFEIIKGPLKKISFRTLLHRFQFSYFLSRDDYNSEHLLRTSELRRAGVVSLGINHGLPTPALNTSSWIYIDYDVYFSLGEQLSKTSFGAKWPKDMVIRPVGSLGMSKRHQKALQNPRPKDIIYFTGPGLDEDTMDEAVIKIAQAFPEKKIYVRNKRRNLRNAIFDNAPINIIHTDENSYDLMLKATYCVGGHSTVIAEAIQFGVVTFSFDFLSPEDENYYRHFPGLCVDSAEEAIDKISKIEAKKYVYPFKSFSGLVDLSGKPIGDIIRQEMGLPPKGL